MEGFREAPGSFGRIQRAGQREGLSQSFGREGRQGGESGGGVEAALHRGGGVGQEAGGPGLPQGAGQVHRARRRGDFSFGLFSSVSGAGSDSTADQSWLAPRTSPGARLACRGKGSCAYHSDKRPKFTRVQSPDTTIAGG